MNSWGRPAGFLVALLVLAACSDNGGEPGWSKPDGRVPPAPANRPPALDVDDVKPCDLLTEDQRRQLGLTGEQTTKLNTTWVANTCGIWDAGHVHSASVTAVSTSGIADFYRGRFANMQYRPTEVTGFPALFYRFDGVGYACYTAVGVADDQLVDVAFGAQGPNSTTRSQDELCDTAHKVVEAAMATLLATR
ncbi:MAG TPA: DUF3558 domain-containing protein [Amycolatopsis sp.]|uniref:DUF3558 domain-containing protein n=1 Tax=Amycolatopsis sp. TaxID=37632 RepID=UPI002B4A359F|nr:DUF3558 domain-containing protein [Amycolatopsis sp.]HKS48331.1 DUF3558 domain-containing protein [Amycolatopsis sp.]